MSKKIKISINGKEVDLYHGATLKHALLKVNEAYYKQVISQHAEIRDQEGNVVEINGAVDNGFRYFIKTKKEH